MEWIFDLDHQIFHLVHSTLAHPLLDVIFPAITDLHKTTTFKWLFPIFILALFWRTYRFKSLLLILGLISCVAMTDVLGGKILKKSLERPRPFQTNGFTITTKSPASGYSFPSNHALNTFAMASYISTFMPTIGPVCYLIATLVAYSRVYNGVHFPLDVIVGALIGLLIGKIISFLISKWLVSRKKVPA